MKKGKLVGTIALLVLATTLVVGCLGFLTDGFRESSFNTSVNVTPKVDIAGSMTNEGWQLQYIDSSDHSLGFKALRSVFSVDMGAVETWEKQGYTVQYGVVYGKGSDVDGTVYNTSGSLVVKQSSSGDLLSGTENATAVLLYSTDEQDAVTNSNWLLAGFNYDNAASGRERQFFVAQFDFDNSAAGKSQTYVAAAFVRLIDETGRDMIGYSRAKEVIDIDPLTFGS